MTGRLGYLPSTFEERGTAVPFTTPLLTQARVRQNDRGKLELSVPRFADGVGAFVVPWEAVPQIVSLSDHDRALHEAVADGNLADPHAIRLAALKVASAGAAGPEVARLASLALRTDDEYRVFTNALLIAAVVVSGPKDGSTEAVQALVQEINTPGGQRRTRAGLMALAKELGIGLRDVSERLNRLSVAVAPVGLRISPRRGRLRSLARRLTEFRNSASDVVRTEEMSDVAGCAQACVDVADLTHRITAARLAELDALLANPRYLLARWEAAHPAVERLVERLAWLLDGWDFITEWWFTSLTRPEGLERISALHATVSLLPMIPREELKRAGFLQEEVAIVTIRGRGWVRGMEDWRTGEQVEPAVKRILAANTLAA